MKTSHYMSFAEQTRHYFGRAHVGVPEASLQQPSAWTGHALREDASAWLVELSDADIKEIRAAVDRVLVADLSLGEVGREQFELPHLADRVRTWRDQVHEGIGFILVRGLPVDEWTEYELSVAFWGLGHHLGVPGAQNPDEELLGHVKDYGEAQDDPFVRLYRTTANINFHCDAADIVGLLCLQPAKEGGQSRIVSTVSLFNALLSERPDLVPFLFEPFLSDRRDRMPAGSAPVGHVQAGCYDGRDLRTFYHSEYFRTVERHNNVVISEPHREILDFYDARGADQNFHLDLWLRKGDMQFVSNHHVAHARTAYTDFDEPDRKRHLLRLWLSVEAP